MTLDEQIVATSHIKPLSAREKKELPGKVANALEALYVGDKYSPETREELAAVYRTYLSRKGKLH